MESPLTLSATPAVVAEENAVDLHGVFGVLHRQNRGACRDGAAERNLDELLSPIGATLDLFRRARCSDKL